MAVNFEELIKDSEIVDVIFELHATITESPENSGQTNVEFIIPFKDQKIHDLRVFDLGKILVEQRFQTKKETKLYIKADDLENYFLDLRFMEF